MTTTRAAMDTNNNGKDELPDQSKVSKKGRSCKGTLYYSSALKSKAYNPLCGGIPRAIPEVTQSIVAKTETKASKNDRHLTEFRYACAGNSLYLDRITKDHFRKEQPELPVCYGPEMIAKSLRLRGSNRLSQPEVSSSTGNADLVASGVTKNIRKVGKYVEGSIYEFLYSYGGRPK